MLDVVGIASARAPVRGSEADLEGHLGWLRQLLQGFVAIDGLPVGMMLVGRPWEEATNYRAADAFEQSGDWRDG